MLKLLSVALLAAAKASAGPAATAAPPAWSPAYSLTGMLTIPFAEIEEPFAAFYDAAAGKSRVDYYGGMDRTFQRADLKTAFKLVPMTDEKVENQMECFIVRGTDEAPVEVQSVLPDLAGFQLKGAPPIIQKLSRILKNVFFFSA